MIARRKFGWIGIDFGAKATKVAQLERAGDRLRWRRTIVRRSSEANGPACTGDDLRHALDVHGGFHGRVVACSLPMSCTEVRAVTVPPGNDAERRDMIAQELEAVGNTADGPREFDFWQPGAQSGGESDGIQVVSVATARVTELVETLTKAGLECAVLDGLPCALARAVAMSPPAASEGPVAAIDWGHSHATLAIVERGRAQFTRLLRDCGACALFNEISQTLGLDEAEAIELLTRFGLPAGDDADCEENDISEVVGDILGRHVQRMLDELTRTFAFLRLQRQALLPQSALLFGAGGTVKNAASYLSARLDLPCEAWQLAATEGPELQQAGEEMFGPAAALSALAWK